MKAITICQPWAWAIASGKKRVENRRWATPYRGPLAIHAGASRNYLPDGIAFLERECGLVVPAASSLTFGAVVAIATLTDCVAYDDVRIGSPKAQRYGLDGDPFACGPFCFILENIRRLDEPVRARGALGLWEFEPPQMLAF